MRGSAGDKVRILHIRDAINEIESYIKDRSYNDFTENSMMKHAVVKQLEIIGEASNNISLDLKEECSSIEWKSIIGLRNILVHEYFGIDDAIIWQIVKQDLPQIKLQITNIISEKF